MPDMTTGPELDMRLAEMLKPAGIVWFDTPSGKRPYYVDAEGAYSPWNASTNRALAHDVIEAMEARGYIHGHLGQGGVISFWFRHPTGFPKHAEHSTFAGAVALAAVANLEQNY